jgi:hypothetical protein
MNNENAFSFPSAPLIYSTPERLIQDFASRGLVVLSPESLGIPADIHDRIHQQEKIAYYANKPVTPSSIPDVLEVLNAPGLIAACNQLVGENWAIVPFTHNASFASGPRDQHWHKDDNSPNNGRKQRHHQAVQIELLYYPQAVREDMGPTAIIPYSHYWTFNHEENHDNFSGADHLDFDYMLSGMESKPASGPESKYDIDDIIHRRTPHDVRMRDAVTNTGWPLVQPFEAAPLRAGSVILYSHNTFHRGNHRRDDWRTWHDNPRFMWRFWLYRTTNTVSSSTVPPAEVNWKDLGLDPLTKINLSEAGDDLTVVWRYHHYWMKTGRAPPPRPETLALSSEERERKADSLFGQLHAKHEEAEPARIGAAYQLASIGDTKLAVRLLGQALYHDRENVRRAATYGLVAVGPDATNTLLEATISPVKWVRKAGVYGLGDASPLCNKVLRAVSERLKEDPSVYVRSVAAGTLGCLGRRAIATGVGDSLVPACLDALAQSLSREKNRGTMDRLQGRSIKFVRPTDLSDICEGSCIDYGHKRFRPVRSAVRENALWSIVILCSNGSKFVGSALETAIFALKKVVRDDENVICVGFAMDALNRLANLHPKEDEALPIVSKLKKNLPAILRESPVHGCEVLVRGAFNKDTFREEMRELLTAHRHDLSS